MKIDIEDKQEIEEVKKRTFSTKEKKVVTTFSFTPDFRQSISNFCKENSYGSVQALVEDAIKKLMRSKNFQFKD